MKIIVPVKRVTDHSVNVRIVNGKVDTENVRMSINPFDEVALAEAIRLRNEGYFNEVITVSIGKDKTSEQLRTSLAQGADRAILVNTDNEKQQNDSLLIAKALKSIITKEDASLVIMGKQSSDSDSGSIGEILSVFLGWDCVPYVSKIEMNDDCCLAVHKETDYGVQIWQVKLPTVITADLNLIEPKPVSIKDMISAKKKNIEKINIDDLNNEQTKGIKKQLQVIDTEENTGYRSPVKVTNIDEMVTKIKERLKEIK